MNNLSAIWLTHPLWVTPLRAVSEWMLIAEYLFFGSFLLTIALVIFTVVDRWRVRTRGQAGTAVIQQRELVHHLPHKIWEVKLLVTPDDRTEGPFRCRSRWDESLFDPSLHPTGSSLPVRFRRYPRRMSFPRQD
jgi:hypothetical protein